MPCWDDSVQEISQNYCSCQEVLWICWRKLFSVIICWQKVHGNTQRTPWSSTSGRPSLIKPHLPHPAPSSPRSPAHEMSPDVAHQDLEWEHTELPWPPVVSMSRTRACLDRRSRSPPCTRAILVVLEKKTVTFVVELEEQVNLLIIRGTRFMLHHLVAVSRCRFGWALCLFVLISRCFSAALFQGCVGGGSAPLCWYFQSAGFGTIWRMSGLAREE